MLLSGSKGLQLINGSVNSGSPDMIFYSPRRREIILLELKRTAIGAKDLKQVVLSELQLRKRLMKGGDWSFRKQSWKGEEISLFDGSEKIQMEKKVEKAIGKVRPIIVGLSISQEVYKLACKLNVQVILVQKTRLKKGSRGPLHYWASVMLPMAKL